MTTKLIFTDLAQAYIPAGNWWSKSHAQVPFTQKIGEKVWVYFSTRSEPDHSGNFTSRICRVPLEIKSGRPFWDSRLEELVLDIGQVGSFDDSGVMGGSVSTLEGKTWLYYCGWSRRVSVPYEWQIGAALLDESGNASRHFKGPVLSSSTSEPFLHAAPTVFTHAGETRMFYLAGVEWFRTQEGKMEAVYRLRIAKFMSENRWEQNGKDLFPLKYARESQTSSAIWQDDVGYHMLFSYRNSEKFRFSSADNYRIGYAYSRDLVSWDRGDDIKILDEAGQPPAGAAEMQGYPHLFAVGKELFLLYCGDAFGEHGFRLARMDKRFEGTVLTGVNLMAQDYSDSIHSQTGKMSNDSR